jgi:hypothetical protein
MFSHYQLLVFFFTISLYVLLSDLFNLALVCLLIKQPKSHSLAFALACSLLLAFARSLSLSLARFRLLAFVLQVETKLLIELD